MEEYARRMASSRCDGDHITLQALCDALKVSEGAGRGKEGKNGSCAQRFASGWFMWGE